GLDGRQAERALAAAGLPTDPLTATAALSPGQQRRLALVRVLHRLGDGADVLVLDEPTAHLDADNAGIVIDMIAEAAASHRVILASHDERVRALAETEIRPIRTREPVPNDSDPAAAERPDASAAKEREVPAAEGRDASKAARQDAPRAETTAGGLDSAMLWEDESGAEHSVETEGAALGRRGAIQIGEPVPNDSDPAAAERPDAAAAKEREVPAAEGRDAAKAARQDAPRAETTAGGLDSAMLWEDESGAEHSVETKAAALRRRWSILRSSLPLLNPTMALAALSACASSLAAIALTAVSAWLIVEASYQPPIMLLMVAIVGVRFFGLSRSVLLYASRLKLHSAIFAALTRLRTSLW